MAWTTPGTATAGSVLTASFWNEQVRDNSNALRDEGGLWLITSANFTTAAAIIADSVFSASYINYRLMISTDCSANDVSFNMRMRTGGATSSANSYSTQYCRAATASVSGNGSSTTAFESIGVVDDNGTAQNLLIIEFMSPFTTAREMTFFSSSYSAHRIWQSAAGVFAATTSFDGFDLYPTTGTVTGRYWLYGYRSA